MCWVSKLRDEHRRSCVLETQTKSDDGTSDCKHDQSICKRLQEHAEYDDQRANYDSVFPSDLFDEPPQEELREDTTETLGAVEDS